MTLIGQRVYGIALGYEDLNDHDELRNDPVMAVLAGKLEARREDCAPVAGKSTLNRLELSQLEPTRYHKIATTRQRSKACSSPVPGGAQECAKEIILDLDATDDPVHGEQEGRFFRGYYDCYCYSAALCILRPPSVGSQAARGRRGRGGGRGGGRSAPRRADPRRWPNVRILLRADSGFAREELMAWCEANGVRLPVRLGAESTV